MPKCLSRSVHQKALGYSFLCLVGLLSLVSCGPKAKHNLPPSMRNATFNNDGVPFNGAKNIDLLALAGIHDPEGGVLTIRVNRTISGADIGTLTVAGTSATFVPLPGVEGRAVFELVAVDASQGVSPPATLTVDLVDTKAPVLEAPSYSITTLTNLDVSVDIKTSEKDSMSAPTGWTRAGITGDWTFSRTYTANITGDPFTVQDRAGNSTTVNITIANIDKTGPVVEDAAYAPAQATNQDVLATLRSVEDLAAPTGWAKSHKAGGKYAFTKTFAANATETVSFFNAMANRTDKVVAITWIDKTAPAIVTFADATTANANITRTLQVMADESGTGYLWFPTSIPSADPTEAEVVAHATTDATVLTLTKNEIKEHPKTDLHAETDYVAFLVLEDAVGNRSALRKLSLRTQPNPNAPTDNPAPTGLQSGSDLTISWGLADADGTQFGKVELLSGGSVYATNNNVSGASSVTFTNVARGTYTAIAYGAARNGTTGQWVAVISPAAPILQANQAPVLPATITLPDGLTGAGYAQTLPEATDADGDIPTYALTGTLPAGLSFAPGNRTLSGTPTQAGTFPLSYQANDGQGGTASRTVSLTVAQRTFAITASAGAGGTISPSGTVAVNQGASQAFSIVPATGYHVVDVLVDGSSIGAATSRTFNDVQTTHSITATFAINTYAITASAGAGGTISPSGATTLNFNSSQIYAIAPNANYRVLDVLVDGVSVGAVTTFTFSNVSANHTIAATFTIGSAWSENSGWIDAFPTGGGVTYANGRLAGYAWGENMGWLRFQGIVPPASGPYPNTDKDNWGVNVDGSGNLSGYAWSENAGWIDFGATGGNAQMDLATGLLSGYAWSENLGWIKLAGMTTTGTPYHVQLKL